MKKIIINESVVTLIENYELAKKYLKDKLTDDEFEILKRYCEFPQYFSVYSQMYLEDVKQFGIIVELNKYYAEEHNWLKVNALTDPVKAAKGEIDRYFGSITSLLSVRREAIEKIKKINQSYLRNITKFLKGNFSFYELKSCIERLNEIIIWLNTYKDYPESELKTKILNTAFSSKATSLQNIINFLHDSYEDDLHFKDIKDSEELKQVIEDQQINAKIYYDKNNVVLLKVDSHEDLRALTCNSKYCFSRSNSIKHWYDYAKGDFVFLLFDFNYRFPDYLTAILPDLRAYDANNNFLGNDEKSSSKEGARILKKYLSKQDYRYFYNASKDY